MVWHVDLLHKLKSYGISGQVFGLISSFLSNRWLQVVLNGKSWQEYQVNDGVPQGYILCPALFFTGIDSWVQPSLKLSFNWVLKPSKPR